MAVTHLDCVQVSAPDPNTAARAWEHLLGRRARRVGEASWRIGMMNSALEIVPGAEEALSGLVFAGRLETGPLPQRGVAAEIRADAPAPSPSPRCDHVAPEAAAIALDHVVVRSDDLDTCLEGYRQLGLRLALDRTFPERGVRLVFFRFGHVTLELSGSEPPPATRGAVDHLWGLAWRVPSIEAARGRADAAGFGISEFRPGHKAGTRVFTVEGAPCGVPALVIEDPSREDPLC